MHEIEQPQHIILSLNHLHTANCSMSETMLPVALRAGAAATMQACERPQRGAERRTRAARRGAGSGQGRSRGRSQAHQPVKVPLEHRGAHESGHLAAGSRLLGRQHRGLQSEPHGALWTHLVRQQPRAASCNRAPARMTEYLLPGLCRLHQPAGHRGKMRTLSGHRRLLQCSLGCLPLEACADCIWPWPASGRCRRGSQEPLLQL